MFFATHRILNTTLGDGSLESSWFNNQKRKKKSVEKSEIPRVQVRVDTFN